MTRDAPDNRIDTDEKLALRQREQLSALVDGELPADQARFLLRRLAHDGELAGRMERWQLAGDVLRGDAVRAVPGGTRLAARVADAIAAEAAPVAPHARWRWRRIGGLAAAAAVAAVAVGLVRPALDGPDAQAAGTGDTLVAAPPAVPAEVPVQPTAPPAAPPPAMPAVERASVPQFADAAPAETRRPAPTNVPEPEPALVASVSPAADEPDPVLLAVDDARPFATPAGPRARPWPRATLPGLEAPSFTVDFGDAPAPSFHPFDPQPFDLPTPEDPEPDR